MKKTVELGFYLALALILAYVESLIPFSFGIPGIKLGLPNLIVLLLLYRGNANQSNTDQRSGMSQREMQQRAIQQTGLQQKGIYQINADQNIMNQRDAILVNVMRIVLSGFLFSNLYTILYALAGALFSFAAMLLGRRFRCFSMIGVSVLGGVFHNIGQIIVAMLVVETFYVGYYIPFLILSGTVTGAVLGIVGMELMPYIQKRNMPTAY